MLPTKTSLLRIDVSGQDALLMISLRPQFNCHEPPFLVACLAVIVEVNRKSMYHFYKQGKQYGIPTT